MSKTKQSKQLGLEKDGLCFTMTKILNDPLIKQIATGENHSAFVREDGKVFVFGENNYNQCGMKRKVSLPLPTLLEIDLKVKFVGTGANHTFLFTEDSSLYMFGLGSDGRLGFGDNRTKEVPTLLFNRPTLSLISSGYRHTIMMQKDGSIHVFGEAANGALGFEYTIFCLNTSSQTFFLFFKGLEAMKPWSHPHSSCQTRK